MTIQYFNDRPIQDAIEKVGIAATNRINEKKIRAKKLQEDPHMIASLAPAYRAAKKAGNEQSFLNGLGVDSSFGDILGAYTGTPQEQLEEARASADLAAFPDEQKLRTEKNAADLLALPDETKLRFEKNKMGLNALNGYNEYIKNLPSDEHGNHLRQLATLGMANPDLANYLEQLDVANAKGANKTPDDMFSNYLRWRTAYQDALTNFNKADKKGKDVAAQDLNQVVQMGEALQASGMMPPTPMTEAKEVRRGMFRTKRLELVGVTPENIDPLTIAIGALKSGKFPDGTPANEEDFKSSNLYKNLTTLDKNKLNAVMSAPEPEEEPSLFDKVRESYEKGKKVKAAREASKPKGNFKVDVGPSQLDAREPISKTPLADPPPNAEYITPHGPGDRPKLKSKVDKPSNIKIKTDSGTFRNSPNGEVVSVKVKGEDIVNRVQDLQQILKPNQSLEDYINEVMNKARFSARAHFADNRIESLAPDARPKVEMFLDSLKKAGLQVDVRETKRSQERQEYLFTKGRSSGGSPVTWTLTSDHRNGRAIDIFINGDRTGRNPGYTKAWNIAKSLGLNFIGENDPGHFAVPEN